MFLRKGLLNILVIGGFAAFCAFYEVAAQPILSAQLQETIIKAETLEARIVQDKIKFDAFGKVEISEELQKTIASLNALDKGKPRATPNTSKILQLGGQLSTFGNRDRLSVGDTTQLEAILLDLRAEATLALCNNFETANVEIESSVRGFVIYYRLAVEKDSQARAFAGGKPTPNSGPLKAGLYVFWTVPEGKQGRIGPKVERGICGDTTSIVVPSPSE
jgi:hypothetical protein